MDAFVPDHPWVALFAVVVGVAVFLWMWAKSRREVARYTSREVQLAMDDLFAAGMKENWDLFMSYPIDDPYLESVRQRCVRIDEEHDAESEEGRRLVREVLREMQEQPQVQTTRFIP